MLNHTILRYYTADECDFPLEDLRCEKPVEEFGPWQWGHTLSEEAAVQERWSLSVQTAWDEVMSAGETAHKEIQLWKDERMRLDEEERRKARFIRKLAEGLRLAGRAVSKTVHPAEEGISLAERRKAGMTGRLHEGILAEDEMRRAFSRSFSELMGMQDTRASQFYCPSQENLQAGEAARSRLEARIEEGLSPSDDLVRAALFFREMAEGAGLGDGLSRRTVSPQEERAQVKDARMARYADDRREEAAVEERRQSAASFARTFSAALSLADRHMAIYAAQKEETLAARDNRIRQVAAGVLSNVLVSEGVLTDAGFETASNTVAGYAPFSEFKVGDYEYAQAIFRLAIKKNTLDSNPLLYNYAVHVDIPDTLDRGRETVEAEETKIYFNKSYYQPPEVNATVLGGVGVTIPYILQTDGEDDRGRYFVIVLKDETGKAVSGTFSWSARGY